ncbi:hypothetical protein [Sphingobium ummariense]
MTTDSTIALAARMVEKALRPLHNELPPETYTAALFRGVNALIRAGAYERDGVLMLPRTDDELAILEDARAD